MVTPPHSGSSAVAAPLVGLDALYATRLDDGLVVHGWIGALVLPSPDRAQIVIRRGAGGLWLAEQGALCNPVYDGTVLDLTGERWRLSLPDLDLAETAEPEGRAPLELAFVVDGDEQRIALALSQAGFGVDVGVQPNLRPLYALARDRLRARRRGVDPAEAGWTCSDELARHLEIPTSNLFVQLWRLRRQLDVLGVPGADGIVQIHPDGRLRVGSELITVEKVG